MPIYETFEKRKRKSENAGKPVIHRNDVLPHPFRVQVAHIWNDTIGNPVHFVMANVRPHDGLWVQIHDTLAREIGIFRLWGAGRTHQECCELFLLHHSNVDQVLSLIEIAFRVVDTDVRGMQDFATYQTNFQPADEAIAELNHRFREHGIGYQYQGGQIIAVNSQYLHSEVVEPAISLLHDANFSGALDEFMAAHEHYRKGDHKEAIANAGNAFESAMKTICDKRGWAYDRATASALIEVLYSNALIPPEMKNHFTGLRSVLQGGVPPLRNQAGRGAHGQGSTPVAVPDYLAAYCLHLAAANIVFLMEAHNAKP